MREKYAPVLRVATTLSPQEGSERDFMSLKRCSANELELSNRLSIWIHNPSN